METRLCVGWRGGRLEHLGVNRNGNLVADKHTAGLQRDVPVETPILAAERGAHRETHQTLATHVLRLALARHFQRHRMRDTLDGEIASDASAVMTSQLNTSALIGDCRILLHVKKVRRAEMPVTLLIASGDAISINCYVHDRSGGIRLVKINFASEFGEAAFDGRHHHVLYRELDQ